MISARKKGELVSVNSSFSNEKRNKALFALRTPFFFSMSDTKHIFLQAVS